MSIYNFITVVSAIILLYHMYLEEAPRAFKWVLLLAKDAWSILYSSQRTDINWLLCVYWDWRWPTATL